MAKKRSLSWDEQLALLRQRKLAIADEGTCKAFLAAENYYRFAGYARYFQKAPHDDDNDFLPGVTFDQIRALYDADEELRKILSGHLAYAEILLRSHTAYVIAHAYGPRGRYLDSSFYSNTPNMAPTVESLFRDIRRSKEQHILRFSTSNENELFAELPIWSAVDA
ncbi:Abi family protein [Rathayibacter toxicus]|uniref:Abi family protein n=1 Tax=Rathayibacter toxicus TaxID=145458 RepID=UPI000ADDF370|nr:Abi family protein [Rathayibacter toxicus]